MVSRSGLLIVFITLFLLSSCGFHQGALVSNAQLGDNDFEIIDLVSASKSTKRYFGLGGLEEKALVFSTKKELYKAYPLKKNQVFANLSVDFHHTTIFFVSKTRCTISADLVQFGDVEADSVHALFKTLKPKPINKSQSFGEEELPFYKGQKVFFKSGSLISEGTIKALANEVNLIQVMAGNQTYNLNYKNVFYNTSQEEFAENIGEFDTQKEYLITDNGLTIKAKIVGANQAFLILKTDEKLLVKKQSELE